MKKHIVYFCDFCGDSNENISLMSKHEIECEYNPKNKACETCSNIDSYIFCKIKKTAVLSRSIKHCKDWCLKSIKEKE